MSVGREASVLPAAAAVAAGEGPGRAAWWSEEPAPVAAAEAVWSGPGVAA